MICKVSLPNELKSGDKTISQLSTWMTSISKSYWLKNESIWIHKQAKMGSNLDGWTSKELMPLFLSTLLRL